MEANPPITQQATVRSRIKPGLWAIVALFTGMGLVWLPMMATGASSDPGQRIGGYIMLSFCLVPAAGFAALLLITEIVADAQGINWRDFRGRHFVPWEDVTDYYELPDTRSRRGGTPRLAVVTTLRHPRVLGQRMDKCGGAESCHSAERDEGAYECLENAR